MTAEVVSPEMHDHTPASGPDPEMPARKPASLRDPETPDSKSPSLPGWVFPPPQGFVADDLDRIPHLPAHTELIDGSLVFVSQQRDFHTSTLFLLHAGLLRTLPADHRVRREMSIRLADDQRPEPDLIVLGPGAEIRSEATFYQAQDVVLAVEVVSPESKTRDRDRKPVLYARAGIPHFWRVESQEGRPVVHVHELDEWTKAYTVTGVHHDRLKLAVPFDIDVDLAEIDHL
ncbi:Uma2 family endonuclease [Nonomuraea longicatena]|uniref:Uma2 family endonuclease n=2 Tax=Nonomuraea longicatena TaxID=83682 RepID=A0ABP4A957_9ACTN